MTTQTERKQVFSYDRIIKTRAWTSLLLVNPKGDLEVNGLLAFCRLLQLTVVWDPEFITPRAPPTERARRAAVLARLLVTAGANPRLRIYCEQPMMAAAGLAKEQVAGDLKPFSGAVLAQLDDTKPMFPQLRAWGALVAPGGLLIGKLHGTLTTRAELARALPRWRPWPNGLWISEVDGLNLPSEVPADLAWTVDEKPASPIAGVELSVLADQSGSGLSTPPLDVSRETPENISGISGAGPIRPPVLNLRRTRPVWDTLEANLGLS